MPGQRKILSSAFFYDTIAQDYDKYLQVADDQKVRDAVTKMMTSKIPQGVILDFGGGTGLDLEWLSKRYTVYFLEPSAGMRAVAKERRIERANAISFVEEHLDFTEWTESVLPVQVDGILANFAVLNCIENIPLLFNKLALLTKPGSFLFATVLDASFVNVLKNYSWKNAIKSLFAKVTIASNYKDTGHTTYLHSLRDYEGAARNHFDFVSYEYLSVSNFRLLVLQRK